MQKLFSFLSFSLLLLALVFAALAKGGNSVWAREIIILAVILAWALLPGAAIDQSRARGWFIPWATLTVFIVLQLLAPFGKQGFYTAMPLQTLAYWAIFSAYWLMAWLVTNLSLVRARWLIGVLVMLAVFQAMYGLVAFLGGQETILGIWEKQYYLQEVTGSFVNRNHFAGYLALLLGVGLSFFFAYENAQGVRPVIVLRVGLAVLYSLVLIIAILGSHSRMGMIAGLSSGGIWLYLYVSRGQAASKWSKAALLGLVPVVLLGMVWFGMGRLIARFTDAAVNERYLVWDAMMNSSFSSWLFGTGAGSFADFFGTIAPMTIQGDSMYYEAHNDWLEFALDFGLIGALCIVIAFAVWFYKMRPGRLSLLQYGAMSGIIAISIHSLADFNLQIPGVALTFWAVLGLLMNPNLSQQEVELERRERRRGASGRWRKRR